MSTKNIVQSLDEGRISFSYTKKDGTLRKATGTTAQSLMPESARVASNNTDTSDKVNYYDLDRSAWRSFRRSALDVNSVQAVNA